MKHPAFVEEQEWRAIYIPDLGQSAHMENSTETINGVPQIIYRLPLDERVDSILGDLDIRKLFGSLIIGPTQYPSAMYQAFVRALQSAGVDDAANKVVISGIPVRT